AAPDRVGVEEVLAVVHVDDGIARRAAGVAGGDVVVEVAGGQGARGGRDVRGDGGACGVGGEGGPALEVALRVARLGERIFAELIEAEAARGRIGEPVV